MKLNNKCYIIMLLYTYTHTTFVETVNVEHFLSIFLIIIGNSLGFYREKQQNEFVIVKWKC